MNLTPNTNVRMFGSLHSFRRRQGLPAYANVYISAEGCSGRDLARELELPLDKVEGVFINNSARSLDDHICPGDSVAFIPTGVPGSHRFSRTTHSAF